MGKRIEIGVFELVIFGVIGVLLGGTFEACMVKPARAGSNSSVYENADRIARSVEHIERIAAACAKRTNQLHPCDVP